ncbi:MAG: tRNA pseudouridine(55) synthase TruB [Planctomycetaceae bacterium]
MFGFLNLYKPEGLTSRDVVNRIYRHVKPAKCGHAGTLDPMATGVLLVCVGPATRLISWLQDRPKTYVAQFILGQTSDTDDSTGIVTIDSNARPVTPDDLQRALMTQVGQITQVPPAFSAVHVSGQRAYDLARQGVQVDLQPRQVTVHSIEILSYEWPILEIRIQCGSGTYIRSIARDIGTLLGCGALMSRLERTAIGEFTSADALPIDPMSKPLIQNHLKPASAIVSHLPRHVCSEKDQDDLRCGRTILTQSEETSDMATWETGSNAALVDTAGELLAIAEILEGAVLQPRLVFRRGQIE